MTVAGLPEFALPAVTAANEHFWRSGRDGVLRLLRCDHCGRWVHPPGPVCTACHRRTLRPAAISGTGSLYAFTVNEQRWSPSWQVPYVIGIVELDEQPGLRLTTNLVDVHLADIVVGMRLRVVFVRREDVFLPLFAPIGERG